jgi:DNA-binding NtrC family response regulator
MKATAKYPFDKDSDCGKKLVGDAIGIFTRNLVGRTVAEVERDLILETLKHCLGNRTHAANILGISIRTLRNKLNEYAADGSPIPPPHGGDLIGAA